MTSCLKKYLLICAFGTVILRCSLWRIRVNKKITNTFYCCIHLRRHPVSYPHCSLARKKNSLFLGMSNICILLPRFIFNLLTSHICVCLSDSLNLLKERLCWGWKEASYRLLGNWLFILIAFSIWRIRLFAKFK